MSKVFYSQSTLNPKMTTILNNLTEINDTHVSKEYYEKNRKIKEKYMKKIVNPDDPSGNGVSKKQELSARRKDIKHEQSNNNQYHNRTSKIKEKMFCAQDEIDIEQDLESERRISQEIEKNVAQEALADVWFQRLLAKSKEDIRFEPQTESHIMYFMEQHDVDPAQLAFAEKSFQGLLAQSQRFAWFEDDDDDGDDDAWYTGCWH
jgi:hypothetical protein